MTPDEEWAALIIKGAFKTYIDIACDTALAGLPENSPCVPLLVQMRYLHLAEPHLPAMTAVEKLKEAGLLR